MKAILRYILLRGMRDRLFIGIFFTLLISFSLAIFLGKTSLTENAQTVAVYVAGLSRIIIIIGTILFVCLNINRAFENKEIEFVLSKAISREQFILAYLTGFIFTAVSLVVPVILAISLIAHINKLGMLIWFLSLLSELIIMICFALVTSLILKNSLSSILAAFGFYAISRLMGIFVLAINLPQDFSQAKEHLLPSILKILSIAFPRLDLFTQSEWLIYGVTDFSRIKIIALQSAIYIPLLIFMAFHDFKKKQF